MAQSATGFAKRPAAASPARAHDSRPVAAATPPALRAIPLNLVPLLAPYKKHGRLSLRIERLHHLARLSAGRNNGDRSWSLTLDELEDLAYLLPEGVDDIHTLAIRVIGLSSGAGLAVLDFPIASGAKAASSAGIADNQGADPADAKLLGLRDELARIKDALAANESELAKMRSAADPDSVAQKIDTELAIARAAWASATDERLAAASAQAATELERQRELWQAQQNAHLNQAMANAVAKAEEDARLRTAEAHAQWQQDSEAALAKAQSEWKAGEAARLVSAQAQWQEESPAPSPPAPNAAPAGPNDTELRTLREKLTVLQATLADREAVIVDAHTAAEQARKQWKLELDAASANANTAREQIHQSELSTLRTQLTALQVTLADREVVIARINSTAEQARLRWQAESDAVLTKAHAIWQTDEDARFAAAQAQWEEKSATALVQALSTADATRDRDNANELRALREKLASVQSALTDHKTASLRARLDAEQTRIRWQQESEATLAMAKAAWKADEDARLAVAQSQWQQASTVSLAEARADADTVRRHWQQELEAALAAAKTDEAARLAHAQAQWQEKSAAALADVRAEAETARQRLRQEWDSVLANARAAWKADEAARAAMIETQLRKKSASFLAEATARYEAAETALAQLRIKKTAELNPRDDAVAARMHDDLATLRTTLVERETELAQFHAANGQPATVTRGSKIVLQPHLDWGVPESRSADRRAQPPRRPGRDVLVAAALAASAILYFYPRLAPFIPESLTANLAVMSSGMGSAFGNAGAPAALSAPETPHGPKPHMALVVNAVNVRAAPSATAAIVSTAQRGWQVATIEQRGNWMLVRIDDKNAKTKPGQGWVYSAFLKAGDETSPAAKRN